MNSRSVKKIKIDETVITFRIVSIFCILFLAAKVPEVPASACAAPGPPCDISVSANGRYLVKDDLPFFYMGDTAWGLFYQLTNSEIIRYFDQRVLRGFNTIQIFSIIYWKGYISVTANPDGELPFIDGDPEKFNPVFWDRVKWILGEARNRGLYCAMAVGGLFTDGEYAVPKDDPGKAYRVGRQFGLTLKDYNDIIIWVGGQDIDPGLTHWNNIKVNVRAEMEGIADAVNDVAANHDDHADYRTTLMTYHPRGGHSSSEWFHDDVWLDFNWIQTYGNLDKAIDFIEADRRKIPAKPTMLAEGAYEDTQPYKYINQKKRYKHYVPSIGRKMYYYDQYGKILPWHVRYQAYQTVFSGGAGYGYGHRGHIQTLMLDWSRSEARIAEGGSDMLHLNNLMGSHNFLNFEPDQDLVASEPEVYVDKETNCIRGIRSSDGLVAYLYSTRGRAFTAVLSKLDAAGTKQVKAQWYNPRNGTYSDAGTHDKVNTYFDPPGGITNGNDWVLLLKAINPG